MLRGTQVLTGSEAATQVEVIDNLRKFFLTEGFEEVIIPSIWEQETFANKLGKDTGNQMWTFKDKGDRDVCLIPEVTGIIQQLWNESWSKTKKQPYRIFYVSRCYRYERPQLGRYREFVQFGVEILGKGEDNANEYIKGLLIQGINECLPGQGGSFQFKTSVKRGLNYYIENGFEVECPNLGAQKQVAGGGRYPEGIGFAIGIERLILAIKGNTCTTTNKSKKSCLEPKLETKSSKVSTSWLTLLKQRLGLKEGT